MNDKKNNDTEDKPMQKKKKSTSSSAKEFLKKFLKKIKIKITKKGLILTLVIFLLVTCITCGIFLLKRKSSQQADNSSNTQPTIDPQITSENIRVDYSENKLRNHLNFCSSYYEQNQNFIKKLSVDYVKEAFDLESIDDEEILEDITLVYCGIDARRFATSSSDTSYNSDILNILLHYKNQGLEIFIDCSTDQIQNCKDVTNLDEGDKSLYPKVSESGRYFQKDQHNYEEKLSYIYKTFIEIYAKNPLVEELGFESSYVSIQDSAGSFIRIPFINGSQIGMYVYIPNSGAAYELYVMCEFEGPCEVIHIDETYNWDIQTYDTGLDLYVFEKDMIDPGDNTQEEKVTRLVRFDKDYTEVFEGVSEKIHFDKLERLSFHKTNQELFIYKILCDQNRADPEIFNSVSFSQCTLEQTKIDQEGTISASEIDYETIKSFTLAEDEVLDYHMNPSFPAVVNIQESGSDSQSRFLFLPIFTQRAFQTGLGVLDTHTIIVHDIDNNDTFLIESLPGWSETFVCDKANSAGEDLIVDKDTILIDIHLALDETNGILSIELWPLDEAVKIDYGEEATIIVREYNLETRMFDPDYSCLKKKE